MAPAMARLHTSVLVTALSMGLGVQCEDSARTLRRVVVLGRHGTKVPPQGVLALCPAMASIYEKFATEQLSLPDSITPVGMRELEAAGDWARQRYIERLRVLPATYFNNASYTFVAQRAEFCIQSTDTFARAMLSSGFGPPHGLRGRQQVVPVFVLYGRPGQDDLLNCVSDGVCTQQWVSSSSAWASANGDMFLQEHAAAANALASACQQDLLVDGVPAALVKLKKISDGLDWARESGIDASLDGRLSPANAELVHRAAFEVLTRQWVGGPSLPLTACGFPTKLLDLLAAAPAPGAPMSFDFFLNHRELVYSLLRVFEMEIPSIPGQLPGFVSCGSTLFFELHGDAEVPAYVRVILFTKTGDAEFGHFELVPRFCAGIHRCPLALFEQRYAAFAQANGTAQSLCPAAPTATEVLPPESLGHVRKVLILVALAPILLSLAMSRRFTSTAKMWRCATTVLSWLEVPDTTAEEVGDGYVRVTG